MDGQRAVRLSATNETQDIVKTDRATIAARANGRPSVRTPRLSVSDERSAETAANAAVDQGVK